MDNGNVIGKTKEEQERIAFGNYISGLVDGEGCFRLSVIDDKNGRTRQSCKFLIELRLDDAEILVAIRDFWKCGTLRERRNRKKGCPQLSYIINDVNALQTTLVPHFEEFPLRAKKGRDFQIWKEGVVLAAEVKGRKRQHKRIKGLWAGGGWAPKWEDNDIAKFVKLRDTLKNVRQYADPVDEDDCDFPDEERESFGQYLAGLCDGESCFRLRRLSRKKLPWIADASFHLHLRQDDISVLRKLKSFWYDCGSLKKKASKERSPQDKPQAHYEVYDISELRNVLVPTFEKHPLRAKKARDFEIWKRGVEIIYQIKQRKQIPYGYTRGCYPKWKQAEKDEFDRLHLLLKETRQYKEEKHSPLNLPQYIRVDKPSLFDRLE